MPRIRRCSSRSVVLTLTLLWQPCSISFASRAHQSDYIFSTTTFLLIVFSCTASCPSFVYLLSKTKEYVVGRIRENEWDRVMEAFFCIVALHDWEGSTGHCWQALALAIARLIESRRDNRNFQMILITHDESTLDRRLLSNSWVHVALDVESCCSNSFDCGIVEYFRRTESDT